MYRPPPPGLKASPPASKSSTPQPHPSLPARPPPSVGPPPSFKQAASAHPPSASGAPGTRGYGDGPSHGGSSGGGGLGTFTTFKPRSVAAPANNTNHSWNPPAPSISAGPAPPSYAPGQNNYGGYPQGGYPQHQPQYYPQANSDPQYSHTSPPQIRNPFPLPGQEPSGFGRGRGETYDPELEAQIAQWQSAYAGKEEGGGGKGPSRSRLEGAASAGGSNAIPLGGNVDVTASVTTDKGVAAVVSGADGKQQTVVRSGGGQKWQDPSLLEWDPAHFRLFIGNLAGEVTDDSLMKAFSRYTSLQKARVIRDKRTTKSKGYGFVSFSNGDDYFRAAKEMQGKYIGSHPVQIKRSTTEIKATVPTDKRKGGKGGRGGGSSGGGAHTGAGVHKKQNKTKGGLRILG